MSNKRPEATESPEGSSKQHRDKSGKQNVKRQRSGNENSSSSECRRLSNGSSAETTGCQLIPTFGCKRRSKSKCAKKRHQRGHQPKAAHKSSTPHAPNVTKCSDSYRQSDAGTSSVRIDSTTTRSCHLVAVNNISVREPGEVRDAPMQLAEGLGPTYESSKKELAPGVGCSESVGQDKGGAASWKHSTDRLTPSVASRQPPVIKSKSAQEARRDIKAYRMNDHEHGRTQQQFYLEESWRSFINLPASKRALSHALAGSNDKRSGLSSYCSSSAEDLKYSLANQQTRIWEFLSTEVLYVKKLRVVVDLFRATFLGLQQNETLTEVNVEYIFSNIDEVLEANRTFWAEWLLPMLNKARQTGEPMDPSIFKEASTQIKHIFSPYRRFCLEYECCVENTNELWRNNLDFKFHMERCESQRECERLKLKDLLATPWQRLTRYPLLLKAIEKATLLPDQSVSLRQMISHMENFVLTVDLEVKRQQEFVKLRSIRHQISSYKVGADLVDHFGGEVKDLVQKHCRLGLARPLFECTYDCQRQLLLNSQQPEIARLDLGQMRFKDQETRGKEDMILLLFTDKLIICKEDRKSMRHGAHKKRERLAASTSNSPFKSPLNSSKSHRIEGQIESPGIWHPVHRRSLSQSNSSASGSCANSATQSVLSDMTKITPRQTLDASRNQALLMPMTRNNSSTYLSPSSRDVSPRAARRLQKHLGNLFRRSDSSFSSNQQAEVAEQTISDQKDEKKETSGVKRHSRSMKRNYHQLSQVSPQYKNLHVVRAPYPIEQLLVFEMADGLRLFCCQMDNSMTLTRWCCLYTGSPAVQHSPQQALLSSPEEDPLGSPSSCNMRNSSSSLLVRGNQASCDEVSIDPRQQQQRQLQNASRAHELAKMIKQAQARYQVAAEYHNYPLLPLLEPELPVPPTPHLLEVRSMGDACVNDEIQGRNSRWTAHRRAAKRSGDSARNLLGIGSQSRSNSYESRTSDGGVSKYLTRDNSDLIANAKLEQFQCMLLNHGELHTLIANDHSVSAGGCEDDICRVPAKRCLSSPSSSGTSSISPCSSRDFSCTSSPVHQPLARTDSKEKRSSLGRKHLSRQDDIQSTSVDQSTTDVVQRSTSLTGQTHGCSMQYSKCDDSPSLGQGSEQGAAIEIASSNKRQRHYLSHHHENRVTTADSSQGTTADLMTSAAFDSSYEQPELVHQSAVDDAYYTTGGSNDNIRASSIELGQLKLSKPTLSGSSHEHQYEHVMASSTSIRSASMETRSPPAVKITEAHPADQRKPHELPVRPSFNPSTSSPLATNSSLLNVPARKQSRQTLMTSDANIHSRYNRLSPIPSVATSPMMPNAGIQQYNRSFTNHEDYLTCLINVDDDNPGECGLKNRSSERSGHPLGRFSASVATICQKPEQEPSNLFKQVLPKLRVIKSSSSEASQSPELSIQNLVTYERLASPEPKTPSLSASLVDMHCVLPARYPAGANAGRNASKLKGKTKRIARGIVNSWIKFNRLLKLSKSDKDLTAKTIPCRPNLFAHFTRRSSNSTGQLTVTPSGCPTTSSPVASPYEYTDGGGEDSDVTETLNFEHMAYSSFRKKLDDNMEEK